MITIAFDSLLDSPTFRKRDVGICHRSRQFFDTVELPSVSLQTLVGDATRQTEWFKTGIVAKFEFDDLR